LRLRRGREPDAKQPGFAIVRHPWRSHPHSHPAPGDIFLPIEVWNSSLDVDRTVKLALYARGGIREVWIRDLTTDGVLVHRSPTAEGYRSATRVAAPDSLGVEALPGTTIPIAAVFA
jgi:Uma2 family endonuclease